MLSLILFAITSTSEPLEPHLPCSRVYEDSIELADWPYAPLGGLLGEYFRFRDSSVEVDCPFVVEFVTDEKSMKLQAFTVSVYIYPKKAGKAKAVSAVGFKRFGGDSNATGHAKAAVHAAKILESLRGDIERLFSKRDTRTQVNGANKKAESPLQPVLVSRTKSEGKRRLVYFDVDVEKGYRLEKHVDVFTKKLAHSLVSTFDVIDSATRDALLLQRKISPSECKKTECRFSLVKALPAMDLYLETSVSVIGENSCSLSLSVKSVRTGLVEKSYFKTTTCSTTDLLSEIDRAASAIDLE